jgi:hypothetical protein
MGGLRVIHQFGSQFCTWVRKTMNIGDWAKDDAQGMRARQKAQTHWQHLACDSSQWLGVTCCCDDARRG